MVTILLNKYLTKSQGSTFLTTFNDTFSSKKERIKKEKIKYIIMGYKLKTHSGAAKRFKKTGSSVKSRSANRNHILTKQSTKRKRHNRGHNKLTGTVLKMASALIKR